MEARGKTLATPLDGPQTRKKGAAAMAKYGKKASKKVKRAMHKRKHGSLRSGRSGKKVTSRKQAIAIGLSEARRSGAKVPSKSSHRHSKKRSSRSSKRKRSHH
jgi:hypothetical protein